MFSNRVLVIYMQCQLSKRLKLSIFHTCRELLSDWGWREKMGIKRLVTGYRGDEGIFFTGRFLGARQTVAVALLILELEPIYRLYDGVDFLATVFVEKDIEPAARTDAHVVITLGTDVVIALKVRPVEHGVTFDALLPQPFRHTGALLTFALTDPGRENLVNPTHGFPHTEQGPL